jgi:hypothetical protein
MYHRRDAVIAENNRGPNVTEEQREIRAIFAPIAVFEYHQLLDPALSPQDISDRLGVVWAEIRRDAEAHVFTLASNSVLGVNEKVARALGMEVGVFRDQNRWESFVGELASIGTIDDDPPHMCSWIFSELYWNHLSRFKLATAWFFTNAIRIQHKLPEYRLTLDRLGRFLDSLSDSGPPIYDGQTFYPENYSA